MISDEISFGQVLNTPAGLGHAVGLSPDKRSVLVTINRSRIKAGHPMPLGNTVNLMFPIDQCTPASKEEIKACETVRRRRTRRGKNVVDDGMDNENITDDADDADTSEEQ